MDRFVKFFFNKSEQKIEEAQLSTKTSGTNSLFEKKEFEDTSEFQQYLQSIPAELQRIRKKKQSKPAISNAVRMQLLEKCYKNIPTLYFSDKTFCIEFSMFERSKRKSEESQDKLYQYLDQIELCLFNQVTSRFDEFVSMLMTIESIDYLLKDNVDKLSIIRKMNKKLDNNLLAKAEQVRNKQIMRSNKQKVFEVMLKMKQMRDASIIVKQTVNKNKDKCIALVSELKNCSALYKSLPSMVKFEDQIEQCQAIIKKDFAQTFSDETYAYITSAAIYSKQFWESLSNRNDLVSDEQEYEATMILYEEDVVWHEEKRESVDHGVENKILQIVLNGWRNGELGVGPTKAKIDKYLTNLFNEYVNDIKIFTQTKLKQKGQSVEGLTIEQLLQKMSLQFYGKVLEYFTDIHKKYLRRGFSLWKLIMENLLQLSLTVEKQLIPRLSNLIEGVFNIQLFTIKLILEKVIQLLNFKKINCDIEYQKFKNYIGLFQNWEKFFENQVTPMLKYVVPADCPMKDRVYVLRNKINALYLTNNKNQLIQSFFASLHKFVMNTELKQTLQNDTWSAIDIPTQYYDPIGYLISGESWVSTRKNMQTTMLESSLFVDREQANSIIQRRINHDRSSMMKDSVMIDTNKLNFKLIKNECIVAGKTYKITESFLLLIEILEEYVKISQCFPIIKQEVSLKITELARFYNSYSYQLIVGAGAVVFKKIQAKNITARHLALSSLCLQFLMLILQKVSERIKVSDLAKSLENMAVHNGEIIKKLKSILISKVQQCLNEIELSKPPSKGTQGIIANSNALYSILSQYFTPQTIRTIFDSEMFTKYLEKMEKLQIKGKQAAQNYRQEINFFFSELKFLEGVVPEYAALRNKGEGLIMSIFEKL